MADTLLASPPKADPAPAAAPAAQAPLAQPAPAAAEPGKTLIGGEPKAEPKEPTAAEKLYGKLVEKVVTDGDKKSATEPAKPEAKPAEAAKPQEPKPATEAAKTGEQKPIDLKAPDGSLLDPADVEKVASLAKEANLTPEVAQKVVEAQDRAVKSYKDRLLADNAKSTAKWVEDLKADKEFGGEKFNESVELAKRGFHAYAGPELIKLMNDTGWGNHPEVVKTFARIGRTLQEGRFVTGGQPVAVKKSAADILYGGTMGKK